MCRESVHLKERKKLYRIIENIFHEFDQDFRENHVKYKTIFGTNYSCLENHKHVKEGCYDENI